MPDQVIARKSTTQKFSNDRFQNYAAFDCKIAYTFMRGLRMFLMKNLPDFGNITLQSKGFRTILCIWQKDRG